MISSDFYAVYESAGKKADGLVNLYCWAHIRRYFVRAGDANPAQLKYWTQGRGHRKPPRRLSACPFTGLPSTYAQ